VDAVTTILLERSREATSLKNTTIVSVVVHLLVGALLVVVPADWSSRSAQDETTVMTISLGGAPGPRAGGMTPMGGRPVQVAQPPLESSRPQPMRPPAAKTPEMTLPKPGAKPVKPVKSAPTEARGRTPTSGPEVQPGSTPAETGARGVGFGLTTGGGGVGGYLEVGSFCCPDYLATMLQLIQRNWSSKQGISGGNIGRFTILRDGTITSVEIVQSSGYAALDLASRRALLVTRALPPLPSAFPNETLTVRLTFNYQP
jgi:protein TonB